MITDKTLKLQEYNHFRYTTSIGYFFTYVPHREEVGYYHSCRESFMSQFGNNSLWIGFNGPELKIENLNEFFKIIEDKLGLEEKDRLIFYPASSLGNVIIIKTSNFWTSTITNRAFLLLFLRAGGIYFKTRSWWNNKDLISAFRSYELASSIIPAINRFLEGFTTNTLEHPMKDFDGRTRGIYYYFSGKDAVDMEKLLIKPIKEKESKEIWKELI